MFGRDAHLTPTDIFYIIETDKLELRFYLFQGI